MRFYRGLQPFKVMSFDLDDTLYDNSDVIRLAEERFLQCVQEQAQLSDFTLAVSYTHLRAHET